MDNLNGRLGKARELLLTSAIDSKDYQTIKSEIGEKLVRLEARVTENSRNTLSPLKVGKLLDRAMEVISNLDMVYLQGDVTVKRQIIGSIFPEKLVLEESELSNHKSE